MDSSDYKNYAESFIQTLRIFLSSEEDLESLHLKNKFEI